MARAKAFRNDQIERLTESFVGAKAENPRRRRIPENDRVRPRRAAMIASAAACAKASKSNDWLMDSSSFQFDGELRRDCGDRINSF